MRPNWRYVSYHVQLHQMPLNSFVVLPSLFRQAEGKRRWRTDMLSPSQAVIRSHRYSLFLFSNARHRATCRICINTNQSELSCRSAINFASSSGSLMSLYKCRRQRSDDDDLPWLDSHQPTFSHRREIDNEFKTNTHQIKMKVSAALFSVSLSSINICGENTLVYKNKLF